MFGWHGALEPNPEPSWSASDKEGGCYDVHTGTTVPRGCGNLADYFGFARRFNLPVDIRSF